MSSSQEVTALRKSGQLSAAYAKGNEYISAYPSDDYLKNALGWVLYEQIKQLVRRAKQQEISEQQLSQQLRFKLREYAQLRLKRPDLLFSLIVTQLVQLPKELLTKLSFFPKFLMWAGANCFREEDFASTVAQNGKRYPSLTEKTAGAIGRCTKDLDPKADETSDIQRFAIKLIDLAHKGNTLHKPELLSYYKASLLSALSEFARAKEILIPFVRKKRGEFWAWKVLAEVVEAEDAQQAIALYTKACMSCRDESFAINVFDKLGELAAQYNQLSLAKWAVHQAVRIRKDKGWNRSELSEQLCAQPWFSNESIPVSSDRERLEIVTQAEKVIQAGLPQYKANYIGSFHNKKGKELFKFGVTINRQPEELVSAQRSLPANFSRRVGQPVMLTVEADHDRMHVMAITERTEAGLFDSIQRTSGSFRLHPKGFGFINDVYVPHELANQIQDGAQASVAIARRFDKKKNRWGLTAIAIIK